jgi:3-phenylpropionate/trans-cinnamate dioxygenase ferredoxin reductase subunit
MSSIGAPSTAAPAPGSGDPGIVIIGAGQAGVQAAEALRAASYAGPITLVGDEPHGPYHRPPLSKAWLAGAIDAAQLVMRAPELLAKKSIALRTGTRATSLDRGARRVRLSDGTELAYSGLVLATGASARALTIPGASASNVCALRSRDDAGAIAQRLTECAAADQPLVVIGGGFIGLEVAATARNMGVRVTVLEAQPRLLSRVLAPLLSDWYAALHRAHGVELVFDAQVERIDTDGGTTAHAVHTRDGTRYAAALVVVGVGVVANDALARASGLECDRGVVVDACARTLDPLVTAAGDCTARRLADGTLLRLESVHNATEQGKSAAAALLGQDRPFTATPWFWSDQFDKKLQMAGLSGGADAWSVRGTLDAGPFSVWHYRRGNLVAVDAVNAARDHLLSRKLLEARVSPAPEQVADTAFDLNTLLAK